MGPKKIDQASDEAPAEVDGEEEGGAGEGGFGADGGAITGDLEDLEEEFEGAFTDAVPAEADGDAHGAEDDGEEDGHGAEGDIEVEAAGQQPAGEEDGDDGERGGGEGAAGGPAGASVDGDGLVKRGDDLAFGDAGPELADELGQDGEGGEDDGEEAAEDGGEDGGEEPDGELDFGVAGDLAVAEREEDHGDREDGDEAEDAVHEDGENSLGLAMGGVAEGVEDFDDIAARGAGEEIVEEDADHGEAPAFSNGHGDLLDAEKEIPADGGAEDAEAGAEEGGGEPVGVGVLEFAQEGGAVAAVTPDDEGEDAGGQGDFEPEAPVEAGPFAFHQFRHVCTCSTSTRGESSSTKTGLVTRCGQNRRNGMRPRPGAQWSRAGSRKS